MTPVEERIDHETAERFWSKVDRRGADECWPWLAALNNGYGAFTIKGQGHRAHRVAYEMLVGPIPEGLQLDHLCRNRACVNPAHLEPVTGGTNTLRGTGPTAQNAQKTHCKYGHEFTPENTIWMGKGKRERACRTCRLELRRDFIERRSAERRRAREGGPRPAGDNTPKMAAALSHMLRARAESPSTDDGVVSDATFYDAEIGVAYVHWNTAAALVRSRLAEYGDRDWEHGTELRLTALALPATEPAQPVNPVEAAIEERDAANRDLAFVEPAQPEEKPNG